MKILELTNYTAGICGVGTRVKEESRLLAQKGHEVRIFSSDFTKGSKDRAPSEEKIGQVLIRRFKGVKLGGESYMTWNKRGSLEKAIIDYRPDVIIAHAYRHTHTVIASKVAKKIGAKSFLVTHAPFVENDSTRSLLSKWYIHAFHDPFIGRATLKRFDKIIAITKWEVPYLRKLGVPENKISYIPNGIPDAFFTQKPVMLQKNKILFLGRVAPIKNIETLLGALALTKNKSVVLEIVGPCEEAYLLLLKKMIFDLNLTKRVTFSEPIYDLAQKIRKIDSAALFVLPSLREAMPQALIEAMARGKIVLASNNSGTRDIVKDKKNGYLFSIGDKENLARLIDSLIDSPQDKMKSQIINSVVQFKWSEIIKTLERVLSTS